MAADVAFGKSIMLQQHKRRKLCGTGIITWGGGGEGIRVNYDLTFGGGVTVREGGGTRENPNLKTGSKHENTGTDWQKVPECQLARSRQKSSSVF